MKNLVTEYSEEVQSLADYLWSFNPEDKEEVNKDNAFSIERLPYILSLLPQERLKLIKEEATRINFSYRKLMFHLRDKGLLQFAPFLIMHPEKGPTLVVDYSCWIQFDGVEFVIGKLLTTPIKLTHSVRSTLLRVLSSTKHPVVEKSTIIVQHLLADGGRTYLRELLKLNSPILYDWIKLICEYWKVEMTELDFNSAFYTVELLEKDEEFIEKKEIIIGRAGSLDRTPESIGILGWTAEGIIFQTVDGKNLRIRKDDIIKDSSFFSLYRIHNTLTLKGVAILQKGVIRLDNLPRKEVSTEVVETSIVSGPTFRRYIERVIESLNNIQSSDNVEPIVEHLPKSMTSNSFNKPTNDGITIIARAYSGGQDLFKGSPDLDGAIFEGSHSYTTKEDYCTSVNLRLKDGELFCLVIKQEK